MKFQLESKKGATHSKNGDLPCNGLMAKSVALVCCTKNKQQTANQTANSKQRQHVLTDKSCKRNQLIVTIQVQFCWTRLLNKTNITQVLTYQWRIQDFPKGECQPRWGAYLLLPPATKLGQGYVFTGVCDSVNRGGTSAPQSRHPPPEQTPREQTPPWEQTPPGADTSPPRADTPWKQTPPRADTPSPASML